MYFIGKGTYDPSRTVYFLTDSLHYGEKWVLKFETSQTPEADLRCVGSILGSFHTSKWTIFGRKLHQRIWQCGIKGRFKCGCQRMLRAKMKSEDTKLMEFRSGTMNHPISREILYVASDALEASSRTELQSSQAQRVNNHAIALCMECARFNIKSKNLQSWK